MYTTLDDLFELYVLPPGRAVYAAEGAVAATAASDLPTTRPWAERFLAAATTAHDLELRYRRAVALPQYGPKAAALDADLDRALGQLSAAIAVYAALEGDPGADPALAAAAHHLSRELFPRGVGHLTAKAYVEEVVDIQALLARLTGAGDLTPAAAALRLDPFVGRLARALSVFAAEVAAAPQAEGPRWDEVRSARAALHHAQLSFVAAVVGATLADDDATLATRTALLAPVMTQQRALRAQYKARRAATDVDPRSGAPEAPADAQPPGA